MTTTVTLSNHAKYQLANKKVDLAADVLKIILMDDTFVFNEDTHATLADVTASQLATGNGYTQNDKTLASGALTEDDTDDRAEYVCTDVTFTASGGNIGPSGAYIIYDDTTTDDTVICCGEFSSDYTISDGSSLQLQNIQINVA